MSRDFVGALLQLNAEKQVPREALIRALEEGIQAAYRRVAGEEDIFVRIEPDSGRIDVYRGRHVVDEIEDPMVEVTVDEARQTKDDANAGDVIEIEQLDGEHFGRIGAQTAKQIILQRIREVERDQRFDQFATREGELLTGSVSRVEPRAIILDVGKGVEAVLATSEQSPLEHYRIGQPVKAFVLEVRRSARGPADHRVADPQGLPPPPVRARGPRDPRRHGRGQGDRPRGGLPLQGRGRLAPGGPRPGRRDRRPARRPRPGRRRGARRREDRRDPVERGRVGVRRQRAVARPGAGREHRQGAPDRQRDRARADAVARDRTRGPERPARRPADRLADRHPERRGRRRGHGDRGAPRGRRRPRRGRRARQSLPRRRPSRSTPSSRPRSSRPPRSRRPSRPPRPEAEAEATGHPSPASAEAAPAKPKRVRKAKATADEEVAS